LGDVTEEFSL